MLYEVEKALPIFKKDFYKKPSWLHICKTKLRYSKVFQWPSIAKLSEQKTLRNSLGNLRSYLINELTFY